MTTTNTSEQVWETIINTNLQISEERRDTNQVARRTVNRSVVQAKDVVLPAPASEGQEKEAKRKRDPLLEVTPSQNARPLDIINDPNNLSIIAIIGEVLALQVKTASSTWSIWFKAASMGMRSELQMAKVIGAQVLNNWNEQANMSDNESKMAFSEGITMAVSAGLMLAMGMAGAVGEGNAPAGDDVQATKVSTEIEDNEQLIEEKENALKDSNLPKEEKAQLETEKNNLIEKNKKLRVKENELKIQDNKNRISKIKKELKKDSLSKEKRQELKAERKMKEAENKDLYVKQADIGKFSKLWNRGLKPAGKWFLKKGGPTVYKGYGKAMNSAMGIQMMAQATNGIAFTSRYKSKIAGNQRAAGQADSLAKQAEGINQVIGQAVSRNEDLRGSCQQFINDGVGIIKNAADSVTQTTVSMFRG